MQMRVFGAHRDSVLGFGCGAVGGLMVHKIALFEIALKYADVMSLEEVVSQL